MAREGHGHQAISVWAVNKFGDTDRLGEIDLWVHPFEKLEHKNFPFHFLRLMIYQEEALL